MKTIFKKSCLLILTGLGIGTLLLSLKPWLFSASEPVIEISVKVTEIQQTKSGLWFIPRDGLIEKVDQSESFVFRLKHLRTERLPVEIKDYTDHSILVRSDDLKAGDLLVIEPGQIRAGQAVTPTAGVANERLVYLTLLAGIEAAMAEDLDESVRFISPSYHDNVGFNFILMRKLLERAYEEFDQPQIELAEPPVIQIKGGKAVAMAQVRLTTTYQGRRNYLLGDQDKFNTIFIMLDRSTSSWKVSQIEGLRPLGFEEGLLKHLGADLGLPLTPAEREQENRFCMPCRQRMKERFGTGS
ncbi:MAG: hypothetical protein PVJ11_10725 [Syntrophobacterales bacterium]